MTDVLYRCGLPVAMLVLAAGGVLAEIAATHGAVTLTQLVRFTDPAESAATVAVRDGDTLGLGFYLDAGRVHVGDLAACAEQAYAAWAGARLPTEQEWEKACAWDPAVARRRRWPWGDREWTPDLANLDGGALRPAPVGARSTNGSRCAPSTAPRPPPGTDAGP